MTDAVIVAAARTPIGKAVRGSYADVHPVTLAGHVVAEVVSRGRVEPAHIDDVVSGRAASRGPATGNLARLAALRAGFPPTVSGMTVTRACASGLQAIATAAYRIMLGETSVAVAVGVESVAAQENNAAALPRDVWLEKHVPDVFMPMIDTAEVVARRYNVSREEQDQYSLESQRRTAAAQASGRFDQEIVPLRACADGSVSDRAAALVRDEGNRPGTTIDGLRGLEPVRGAGGGAHAHAALNEQPRDERPLNRARRTRARAHRRRGVTRARRAAMPCV
jgi:acetyl-CoA C-acetyltransferase